MTYRFFLLIFILLTVGTVQAQIRATVAQDTSVKELEIPLNKLLSYDEKELAGINKCFRSARIINVKFAWNESLFKINSHSDRSFSDAMTAVNDFYLKNLELIFSSIDWGSCKNLVAIYLPISENISAKHLKDVPRFF